MLWVWQVPLPAIRIKQVRCTQMHALLSFALSFGEGEHAFRPIALPSTSPLPIIKFSSSGEVSEAAGQLDELQQQDERYIELSHMRLLVVFAKYWLAIMRKEKVTEFRSSNNPVLLSAG